MPSPEKSVDGADDVQITRAGVEHCGVAAKQRQPGFGKIPRRTRQMNSQSPAAIAAPIHATRKALSGRRHRFVPTMATSGPPRPNTKE